MASASSDPVDPQLQKSTPEEESAGTAAPTTAAAAEIKKKKKKKILVQEPDWYVKHVLSYKPVQLEEPEVHEAIIKHDPVLAASLYMMMADSALYDEYNKERMIEEQKSFRQQLRTQGRVTREVEVDEDDDRYVAIPGSDSGRGGRRRHRPGVMKKQDGHSRKLN